MLHILDFILFNYRLIWILEILLIILLITYVKHTKNAI